jgi:hypothetical protein
VVQVGEQPSVAMMLPSSHCSAPRTSPSEHTVVQMVGALPVHVKPSSSVQVFEQPSFEFGLPSSHASVASLRPSPQVGAHDEGEPVQV